MKMNIREGAMKSAAIRVSVVGIIIAMAGAAWADPPARTRTIYTPDYSRINETFPGATPVNNLRDMFSVNMKFNDPMDPSRTLTMKAPTHITSKKLKIVGYGADETATDASGNRLPYDIELAKMVKPGDFALYVKGHRPEYRTLDTTQVDPANMKEHFKLQDTHIGIAVGVKRNGKNGAITLNNPQSYQSGRFGDKTYGGFFIKPVLPKHLNGTQKKAYMNNIRNMLVGFNAVSNFPGNYNGGDPLGVHNPQQLRTAVANMILAIAGAGVKADNTTQAGSVAAKAKEWFADPKNQIYCAELAFVSMSAGMVVPMNWKGVQGLSGIDGAKIDKATWGRFQTAMKDHNAGRPTRFTTLNENPMARLVKLAPERGTLAGRRLGISGVPRDLKPEADYKPGRQPQMALKPQTMAGIVEGFLATHVPRGKRAGVDKAIQSLTGKTVHQLKREMTAAGRPVTLDQVRETYAAPMQGALLKGMKQGLYGQMDLIDKPGDTAGNAVRAQKRAAVDQVYAALLQKVSTPHSDYKAFRTAVAPLMAQAAAITGPRPGTPHGGKGLFVPPSIFHLAAKFPGRHDGSLGFKYAGHAIEFSMLKARTVRAKTPRARRPSTRRVQPTATPRVQPRAPRTPRPR